MCLSGAGVHSPRGEVGHWSWVLRASWSKISGLGFILNLTRNPGGVLVKESPRFVFSQRAHGLLCGHSAFGEVREAGSVSGGCCVPGDGAVVGLEVGSWGRLGVCLAA